MNKIIKIIRLIEKQIEQTEVPSLDQIAWEKDPFKVLISCLLSLRTKDKVTIAASNRLFSVAGSAVDVSRLSREKIERLIYPVGFYRKKALIIKQISRIISTECNNIVPKSRDDLLKLKGVGRKTANLVLNLGYDIPAICVDTHVHRISNRLGWVSTKTPFQTEMALEKVLDISYWRKINSLLVRFGQNICLPVSPFCSICSVKHLCLCKGVTRHR